ncbi:hypothetical protein [Rugamonas sp. DEMB1]|uniref:hypothetical protein n=1 Tax=Rugamonas sp. DEMB1 TaxID=3039386 RepID=UPI00244C5263|nr:hypothetical protein [Rugamonas sp. DEMB1]WGG48630.1 hypothetical protein QC826_18390 [Rugamonas sp. DEMB1]
MTSKGKDHLDDDEFEAFLRGDGALARQLSALPQPQAPAALDATILAAVRADLAAPASTSTSTKLAANDPAPGAGESTAGELRPQPTVSRLARWRMPLATAASVIGAISLMLQWQRQPESERIAPPRQSAVAPATAESITVAAAPTVASAPTAPVPAAPAAPAVAPAPKPTAAAAPPAPAPPLAASAARAAVPGSKMSTEETVARDNDAARTHIAPPPKAAPASASVLEKPAAEQSVYARATSAPAGYLSAPAPATVAPPAPVAGYGAPAASDAVNVTVTGSRLMAAPTGPAAAAKPAEAARAQAWLNVIDEMLKAELRQDALSEWTRFRLAYPDHPVPETLRARIKAAQE